MATTFPVRKIAAIAVSAGLLVAGLTACSGSSTAGSDPSKLTIAYNNDPAALGYDPLKYADAQYQFFSGLYDGLATTKADGSAGPGLATSFDFNADKTVVTLALVDNVKFSDGSKLSADLVKANLDRRSNKDLSAYSIFAAGGASEIKSVDVVDPTHVSLTFAAPQPGIESSLAGVAGMIVGQKAIDDSAALNKAPDGSGAYTLGSATVKGSNYVLTKNTAYRNAADWAYSTIDYKPITDSQALANAMISGQADVGLIATSTAALVKSKGLSIVQIGGSVQSMLVFDKSGVTTAAFADPNVRVALGMAIDRDKLVSGLHPGDVPAVNALPKDNPGFTSELDSKYGYNPTKAKEMLAAAGYPNGFSFTFVSGAGDPDVAAIQKYFAAVGVTMNIKVSGSTEEAFAAVNTTPLGLSPLSWANPVGTMYGAILGFANPHKDVNPALIADTQAVAAATDDASRKTALTSLNTELVSSGWLIPVYELLTSWAHSDKVAAFTLPPSGIPLLSSFKPAK